MIIVSWSVYGAMWQWPILVAKLSYVLMDEISPELENSLKIVFLRKKYFRTSEKYLLF